jgi:hypothetical protein
MTEIRVTTRGVSFFLVVLLVSAALACNGTPLAPDSRAAQGGVTAASDQPLPWRITATVATTPADPPDGCLVYFTSVIEGTATYLGRFSGIGSTCVVDQVAPDPDPPFTPAGPPPYATAQFTNPRWTLTAANGDELWIEGPEAVAVISFADNSLAARGIHRIVGGTGRFTGATGEAQVGAVNDDGQGPDDFSGTGWIRFQ